MVSTPDTSRPLEAAIAAGDGTPTAGPEGPPLSADAPPLVATWLGRRDFASILELQSRVREAVIAGEGPERLLLVEHEPTVTLGRRASPTEILWDAESLARSGLAVCETPRGGRATLHAPGQLVAYPVIRVGYKIRSHVEQLAEAGCRLLAELGLSEARYRPDCPGVWLGDHKLASIGIHVRGGVTIQGMSLNLAVDRALLGALVSCGLSGSPVTDARSLGARALEVSAAATRWAEIFCLLGGRSLVWEPSFGTPETPLG